MPPPMRPLETIRGLCAHEGRLAGSDAERRAARWLAGELEHAGREVLIEPFWCRPNWAFAHCWHALLALAGSLVAVSHPRAGGALVLVALLSLAADGVFGISLGRLLTPERASQNVVALPPERARDRRLTLVLSANYDAGRGGIVHRPAVRAAAARARNALGPASVGWLAWMAIACVWLIAVAVARLQGAGGGGIGAAQLIPTVGLVVAVAALGDVALAATGGPAAGDNASGVAVALAVSQALDVAPPAHAAVHVVLAGAGDAGGPGLRRYLRSRRRALRPENTILVGIAACGGPRPVWWLSEGPLVPMRHFPTLRRLCARLREQGVEPELEPVRTRGVTPALWGRLGGVPSIALGRLDELGLAPRSHLPEDTPGSVPADDLDLSVQTILALVDAIDAHLGQLERGDAGGPPATPEAPA
jgi:hypothetical protein